MNVPCSDPRTGKRFVNLTEIAERWGVGIPTVLRYHVGRDRLPARKVGRAVLVDLGDLAAYESRLLAAERERLARMERRISKPLSPSEPGRK